ncbi:MAG TPA: RIO1 family regulatory kinase/ATPase [Candidatus Kapabacteria bacterium]|nr:RIO1 family regulatory kinase/ATPase [Candidatus Kapabacteria bacterium]
MPHDDYSSPGFERMGRRRPSRRVIRSLADLTPSPAAAAAFEQRTGEPAPEFREPGLQELFDRGIIQTVVRQLKSGKEATVYVARGADGAVAVKVYHDHHTRGFRNDAVYREGRFVGNTRLERAMAQGSTKGLRAHQGLWVEREYRELALLHSAGVRVPQPLGHAGQAIAMEFVGRDAEPAPRIAEARLTVQDTKDALEQAVRNLAAIVACGCIHGDYSAFNLLWWERTLVVIDLPQLVHISESRHAARLLARDIHSLCTTFSRFNIPINRREITRTIVGSDGGRLPSSPFRTLLG